MSSPLCLDLKKYGATDHSCSCLIACPFDDAVQALGLHMRPPGKSGGRGATGIAHYTVGGQKYALRVVVHTRKKQPDRCCFHIDYEIAAEDRATPSRNLSVGMAQLDVGLSGLFGPCGSTERRFESHVELERNAPVVSAIGTPDSWPKGVVVSGVHLADPSGKAGAIVQNGDQQTFVIVYIDGGRGLSPKQVRSGFMTTVRLAEAFSGGAWDQVAKEVLAYDNMASS